MPLHSEPTSHYNVVVNAITTMIKNFFLFKTQIHPFLSDGFPEFRLLKEETKIEKY